MDGDGCLGRPRGGSTVSDVSLVRRTACQVIQMRSCRRPGSLCAVKPLRSWVCRVQATQSFQASRVIATGTTNPTLRAASVMSVRKPSRIASARYVVVSAVMRRLRIGGRDSAGRIPKLEAVDSANLPVRGCPERSHVRRRRGSHVLGALRLDQRRDGPVDHHCVDLAAPD
jgi:hypothetical protein